MISGNTIVAPVTTADVKNLTGVNSNSINYLITRAKTGGTSGWAFNTTSAGGTINDGYLINNARPYWNIFSNESPGEWADSLLDEKLRFRIKRDAAGSRYAPMLGAFRGYNHAAVGPDDINIDVKIPVGSSTTQTIVIRGRTGSYDWRKIRPLVATAVKFVVVDSDGFTIGESEQQELTAINMTVSIPVTLNIVTSRPSTNTYTIREYIGRKSNVEFIPYGYIPFTGTMKVTVYTPIPEATFAIRMDGAPNTAWSVSGFDKITNKWQIRAKFRRGSTTEKMRRLYKIEYTLVDESGNTGTSVIVTSGFTSNDYPQILDDYGADAGYPDMLFEVQYDRLIPTVAYPQVRIIMYYKDF